MGYECLAAAIIQSAVEDYKELCEFGLIQEDEINLRRWPEFLKWSKEKRKRSRKEGIEARPKMELSEAQSAWRFFERKKFVELADFCGLDAQAAKDRLSIKRGHL